MKTFYWILACGLILVLMQYSLFKENGAPRQFSLPVAVVR